MDVFIGCLGRNTYCLRPFYISFCVHTDLNWWGGGGEEPMLLHTQNRNCSSATGNNLCADDAGLRGTLRKFLILRHTVDTVKCRSL